MTASELVAWLLSRGWQAHVVDASTVHAERERSGRTVRHTYLLVSGLTGADHWRIVRQRGR